MLAVRIFYNSPCAGDEGCNCAFELYNDLSSWTNLGFLSEL